MASLCSADALTNPAHCAKRKFGSMCNKRCFASSASGVRPRRAFPAISQTYAGANRELDLCELGHDHTIIPPFRPACQNLDDTGGKSDQRADLPGRFIRAGKIEDQAATPGSQ